MRLLSFYPAVLVNSKLDDSIRVMLKLHRTVGCTVRLSYRGLVVSEVIRSCVLPELGGSNMSTAKEQMIMWRLITSLPAIARWQSIQPAPGSSWVPLHIERALKLFRLQNAYLLMHLSKSPSPLSYIHHELCFL